MMPHMRAALAVLFVIVIWYLVTHGQGGRALRLVTWLLLTFVVVGLIAFNDPALAGHLIGGFVAGIGEAGAALTAFLKQLFSGH